jgi:hypothetical protein
MQKKRAVNENGSFLYIFLVYFEANRHQFFFIGPIISDRLSSIKEEPT